MKATKTIAIVALFSILFFALQGCDKQEILRTPTEIPAEIQTYVNTHFPDHQILQVIKETDGFTVTYDVYLDKETELEFNRKKEIIKIDSEFELPDSVIPAKIKAYVVANFPAFYIVGWELEGNHQQITLNNDMDIEFTMDGDFIRIDD
ncbi:MAG: PepSY-like domain-containing protein [Bacteroidales bacterium]|jgi:hypothetical protein|nr:PepSY-like domain-containing protein [Bacteroidales bacterium]HHT52053.1 hypothetical protein [Bacteroidales bacterium]